MSKLDQALQDASRETIKAANEALIRLAAENTRLREALEKIAEFGKSNPGFGYSCSKIAQEALKDE